MTRGIDVTGQHGWPPTPWQWPTGAAPNGGDAADPSGGAVEFYLNEQIVEESE